MLDILVFRAGAQLCALPLLVVLETMRPLPTQPTNDGHHLNLGLSLIRGKPCPVVDMARLFGSLANPTRIVLIKLPLARKVALAVTAVEGVFRIPSSSLMQKPPLVTGADRDLTESIGILDGELFKVLQAGALLSDQEWSLVENK